MNTAVTERDALKAALAELLRVCKAMDSELEIEKPSEEDYQAALRQAEQALARCAS